MISPYQLTLNYKLHPGWLEPYLRGLHQGIAVARCCSACKKVSFPPIRVCECQHTSGEWVSLSGEAHIVNRCTGTEGDYALVQFAGADTKTVVRLDNISNADDIGYLQVTQSDQTHSDQTLDKSALVLTSHKNGDNHE